MAGCVRPKQIEKIDGIPGARGYQAAISAVSALAANRRVCIPSDLGVVLFSFIYNIRLIGITDDVRS